MNPAEPKNLAPWNPEPRTPERRNPGTRNQLAVAVIVAATTLAAFPSAQTPAFSVVETTVAGIHAAMSAHRLTCHQLVQAYLDRIAAYDKQGPAINAIVQINPNALTEADAIDRGPAAGADKPLQCIPAIVKDNYETIGLQSADGSASLKGFVSNKDAFLVKRIKDAGAIVLAKSNMAEFAFSPYETINSILPGYTFNPYDVNRVTAGSSGGTAAAIAASFGAIGLGSDTGNSIRGPSSHQALVGIRSTMGLTSRAGVIPLSFLADVAGPMCRTVEDAVRVFQVIVGEDPNDSATAASHGRAIPNYLDALKKDGLKGARIGVLHQAYERGAGRGGQPATNTNDPEVIQIFAHALDELKAAGAEIVDPAAVDQSSLPARGRNCRGFKYDINEYLAAQGDRVPVHSLTEIVTSGKFHSSVADQVRRNDQQAAGEGPDSDACKAEMAYRRAFGDAVTKTMDDLKLDAFVYPTWSNVPRLIGDLQSPAGDNSQVFSPTSGFPAMTVPMGFTRNGTLPAGMTFFGRAWSEATLIRLAYAYEQATHHRKPPPTTPALGAQTPPARH